MWRRKNTKEEVLTDENRITGERRRRRRRRRKAVRVGQRRALREAAGC